MKAIVIKAKNEGEIKFISNLLERLDVRTSSLNVEEIEDLGLSQSMKGIDKNKKASRAEIIRKLSSRWKLS